MASSRYKADDSIEISSGDEESVSSSRAARPRRTPIRPAKRRRSPDADDRPEKTEWYDESDDALERFKNRRKHARRGTRGKVRKSASGRQSKGKDKDGDWKDKADDGPPNTADDYELAEMPEYLRTRRRQFDENREILRDSGLRLPPDYSDIYFSDDERLEDLQEKPQFSPSSGIKPSRPYKDVELEYSAGLIPASIAQYLRDYQVTGVKFLHERFVYQKGCLLGDDMGLGKTVQVAAFLTAAFGKTGDERDAKRMRKMRRVPGRWYPRVLIVCPGSLIENWKQELNRWGWWLVDTYHGSGKDDVLQAARAGMLEIVVTTYTSYRNHMDKINTVTWDAVVADECHVLKERSSAVTKAMNVVNALCRIGLTGTAIQNKYEELWTLLNWTNPGHFGSFGEWRRSISVPLTVGQSHDATLKQLGRARETAKKLVQNLLPEFFLRRMKTLIADQLPKKSDKVVFCPLTDRQREAYGNFLASDSVTLLREIGEMCPCGSKRKKGWCCYTRVSNGKHWMSIVFPTIQTLLKLSNHLTLLVPPSVDPADKQQSALETLKACVPDDWQQLYKNRDSLVNLANPEFCGKWKILRKLLRFWHESGDKVLVFSHSVRLLRILQNLFNNTSYSVSYLDGSLSYEDRQKAVDDFNSDPGQFVFLISTKAGGIGLNITSANKVVIFDPHWNPSYDLQAQDRAYRIGQTRDVDVFRLISAGTIEEIVYARQIYKQQQANIGYNASTERRYFKGVQQDKERKGEIFGLKNLFSFHADQVVLRDIVNKTNIAEAKAGVHLSDIDMEKVANDEDNELNLIKQEDTGDAEEGGLGPLTDLLGAENQEDVIKAKKASKPKTDAIQAILAAAGVEYTHENSEVVGSSKVEAQLSRRAELVADETSQDGAADDSVLFADSQANNVAGPGDAASAARDYFQFTYNPPVEVMQRQFCSMAREFGFQSATDFALVVESWTQEQRRNCLETFYKRREARVLELELNTVKKMEEEIEKRSRAAVKEEGSVKVEEGVKREVGEEDDFVKKEEEDAAGEKTGGKGVSIKTEMGRVTVKKEEEADEGLGSIHPRSYLFLDDDEDEETDEL
ncbi:Switch 2 [Pleurostoma richardsiae]|uniref:Switch 2 n=1 Tax=Pleurostoma richardsiae TaxID=41990 RepID=A0AA38S0H2_9PEZI|nr:Switch 2 [Pleurostoma richardsiae]